MATDLPALTRLDDLLETMAIMMDGSTQQRIKVFRENKEEVKRLFRNLVLSNQSKDGTEMNRKVQEAIKAL